MWEKLTYELALGSVIKLEYKYKSPCAMFSFLWVSGLSAKINEEKAGALCLKKECKVGSCDIVSQYHLAAGSNLNFNFFPFILFPENFSVPPDVTATTSIPASSVRPSAIDLPPSGIVKGMHKASNRSSLMDTADGTDTDLGKEPNRTSCFMYKACQLQNS